jgi:hypothetical protein
MWEWKSSPWWYFYKLMQKNSNWKKKKKFFRKYLNIQRESTPSCSRRSFCSKPCCVMLPLNWISSGVSVQLFYFLGFCCWSFTVWWQNEIKSIACWFLRFYLACYFRPWFHYLSAFFFVQFYYDDTFLTDNCFLWLFFPWSLTAEAIYFFYFISRYFYFIFVERHLICLLLKKHSNFPSRPEFFFFFL